MRGVEVSDKREVPMRPNPEQLWQRGAPSRNIAPPGGIGSLGEDSPQYVTPLSVPCAPFTNLAQDLPLEGAHP